MIVRLQVTEYADRLSADHNFPYVSESLCAALRFICQLILRS